MQHANNSFTNYKGYTIFCDNLYFKNYIHVYLKNEISRFSVYCVNLKIGFFRRIFEHFFLDTLNHLKHYINA
jgi:hypothetical protein